MRKLLTTLLLAMAVMSPARGQAFVNLDFELAEVVPNEPFGTLDWNLAAPGWSHSTGVATESVYYRHTHLGFNQYFLLVDSVSWPGSLLEGSYSFAFSSGFEDDPGTSPFVQAFISQTGEIPSTAHFLRLLATGKVGVRIDEMTVPLQHLGGDLWVGDISAYAGRTVELKIVSGGTFQDPVVVDRIVFLPVPEPATYASMTVGLAWLATLMRRRRVQVTARLARGRRQAPPPSRRRAASA